MPRTAHTGLKPQEQAIMDLRERGMRAREISDKLGISYRRVEAVIGNFGDVEFRDRAFARAMRMNSAAFLARLKAEGQIIVPRRPKEVRHGHCR